MAGKVGKIRNWLAGEVAGHAAAEAIFGVVKKIVEEVGDKAGKAIVKGLSPQEASLEAIVIPRLGMISEMDDLTLKKWIAEGIARYDNLVAEDRNLQKRLQIFNGKLWSAISDGIGKISLKEVRRDENKKAGTTKVVEVPDKTPSAIFQMYLAQVGHLGLAHIKSDLEVTEEAPLKKVTKAVKKTAGKIGTKTGTSMADFLRGFNRAKRRP